MDRMNNVDLQDTLRQIAKTNTFYHLENDLGISVDQMERAAKNSDPLDKSMIWISYPSGVDCHAERQTFQKDTREYNGLLYDANRTTQRMLAYAVEVKGMKDGAVYGDIFEIDLRQCGDNVRKNALESSEVRLFVGERSDMVMSKQEFDALYPNDLTENLIGWRNEPDNLTALEKLLGDAHDLRAANTEYRSVWSHTSKLHDARFTFYADKVMQDLSGLSQPNSADKQNFSVTLDSYVAQNFGQDELVKLMDALPYKNVRISIEKGQRSMHVVVPREEIQQEKQKKPSVLAKLNEGKKAAQAARPNPTAPKRNNHLEV